jgi:SAM-dependent methyltransferase
MMNAQPKEVPMGFDLPTASPATGEQAARWQQYNRQWWESHPMRYDWKEQLGVEDFSPQFYEEIDRRFFRDSEEYLPAQKLPFDRLIPFDQLPHLDVLEIGVGNGSHAALIARHARSFTGIDLTEYAVRSTLQRFQLAGLDARIVRMDAEKMDFPDHSFDFIWTWGVIHHSADTRGILREMHRVLRPEGRAIVMVYHRNFWNYYICSGFLHGLVRGMWLHTQSLHKIMQLTTDGGLARFYTGSEWRATASDYFNIEQLEIYGSKSHILPLPAGRVKDLVLRSLPNRLSCLLNNKFAMGSFLVSHMRRREEVTSDNAEPCSLNVEAADAS